MPIATLPAVRSEGWTATTGRRQAAPAVRTRPEVAFHFRSDAAVRMLVVLVALFSRSIAAPADVPVKIVPVVAQHAIVVASHPEAADIGLSVLKSGGNAIDAAVATSLAVSVGEPYASGLGGKLMLLYYEAKSGRTFAIDAMDAASASIDVDAYRKRPEADRSNGYSAVCVPGLGAGLWLAHQKWGTKKWADDVLPAANLARGGSLILQKTRDLFEEQERKLRRGDAEIARIYLPQDALPAVGSRLRNEDLARTLESFAAKGRDGFYRGAVAEALVTATQKGGGTLTLDDLAHYEARVSEPLQMDFRGYRLFSAPPPTIGSALFLPALKALENETLPGGVRDATTLDRMGKLWRIVSDAAWDKIADTEEARFNFEKLIAPDSIRAFREQAFGSAPAAKKAAMLELGEFYESAMAATTHFIVVDAQGNIVCATQSLSLHFGAGVVAPGTGVVLNNSMSNFTFVDPRHPNALAPGKRSRSTIAPTIVFRDKKPVLALGVPGSARIPTALLQALLDRLALNHSLADAIGDARFHFVTSARSEEPTAFEAEQGFPEAVAMELRARGWKVEFPEIAGRGRYFGGINAVEFRPDGSLSGIADPRRTNAAVGY